MRSFNYFVDTEYNKLHQTTAEWGDNAVTPIDSLDIDCFKLKYEELNDYDFLDYLFQLKDIKTIEEIREDYEHMYDDPFDQVEELI